MEVVEHPVERKRAILDILSLYDHPLARNMQRAVARTDPHHPVGQEVITALDKKLDAIVSLIAQIEQPHTIHRVASKYAPHKFLEAHALVEALDENPLKTKREHIESMFNHVEKTGIAIKYGPAVASNLTELLIDLGHRARSDRLVLERLDKIHDLLKTVPAKLRAHARRPPHRRRGCSPAHGKGQLLAKGGEKALRVFRGRRSREIGEKEGKTQVRKQAAGRPHNNWTHAKMGESKGIRSH